MVGHLIYLVYEENHEEFYKKIKLIDQNVIIFETNEEMTRGFDSLS